MNRRRMLQVFAAASAGTLIFRSRATKAVECSSIADGNSSNSQLLSLLQDVHVSASELESLPGRRDEVVYQAVMDAKFYSKESIRRVSKCADRSPAYWQTCLDRMLNASNVVHNACLRDSRFLALWNNLQSSLPEFQLLQQQSLS